MSLVIVNSSFLGLATIVVILRLYTRTFVTKCLGWDDWFIFAGFVRPRASEASRIDGRQLTHNCQICTIGMNITIDLGVLHYGWDRHEWDILPQWRQSTAVARFQDTADF